MIMADWEVPREGLINFKDPKVKEKGLTSGNEPIQIYLYTIDHPIHGRYLIDTGMADFFAKIHLSGHFPVLFVMQ